MKNNIPLRFNPSELKYRLMIGTGGIGSGSFFLVNGDRTVGREESRMGRFLDRKDLCKLHIISHYVQKLLGPDFKVVPVGKVGNDLPGRGLVKEMDEAGIETNTIEISEDKQTLYSFCFVYPDGSGGNFTTDDSACSYVTSAMVEECISKFQDFKNNGIVLAVPEVPLEARLRLLETGKESDFFCAASFNSEEMAEMINKKAAAYIDLLAVNSDEASVIAGKKCIRGNEDEIAEKCIQRLVKENPDITVAVTAGSKGSWIGDSEHIHYREAFRVEPVNTAGAGDAFMSGLIIGKTLGMDMPHMQELAALIGAVSVMSPHTLYSMITRDVLRKTVESSSMKISETIRELL